MPDDGAVQACEMRVDIAARKVNWSKRVFRLVGGRDINNVRDVHASVVSIWASVLDETVTVEVKVLQTKCIKILLERAVRTRHYVRCYC
jgi:hypothetical protein